MVCTQMVKDLSPMEIAITVKGDPRRHLIRGWERVLPKKEFGNALSRCDFVGDDDPRSDLHHPRFGIDGFLEWIVMLEPEEV